MPSVLLLTHNTHCPPLMPFLILPHNRRAVESVDGASLHDRSLKVAIAAPKKNKS